MHYAFIKRRNNRLTIRSLLLGIHQMLECFGALLFFFIDFVVPWKKSSLCQPLKVYLKLLNYCIIWWFLAAVFLKLLPLVLQWWSWPYHLCVIWHCLYTFFVSNVFLRLAYFFNHCLFFLLISVSLEPAKRNYIFLCDIT